MCCLIRSVPVATQPIGGTVPAPLARVCAPKASATGRNRRPTAPGHPRFRCREGAGSRAVVLVPSAYAGRWDLDSSGDVPALAIQ